MERAMAEEALEDGDEIPHSVRMTFSELQKQIDKRSACKALGLPLVDPPIPENCGMNTKRKLLKSLFRASWKR